MQLHVKIQSLKRHYQSFSLSIQTQARCLPERLPRHILNRLQRRRTRKTTVALSKRRRAGDHQDGFNDVDDNFMPADQLLIEGRGGVNTNDNEFLIRRSMTTDTADRNDQLEGKNQHHH